VETSDKKLQDSDPPRLWVISEVYYPEETSTGYYLTSIAEGLSGDFDVKVICGQPNYSARGIRAQKRELRNGVEIIRAAGTTLNRKLVLFRLVNMTTLGISVLWHGLRRFRRGDKVLVVTTPPNMPFIVGIASLMRGASYVLLIHDSYPEVLVAVGKAKPDSKVLKTIHFLNRWLFKHASKVIVVGRDMKTLVQRKTQGLDVPVVVIPNWAELEDVVPTKREENELIQKLGISDKLVILHAGNIGQPTEIKTVVDAIKSLADDDRFHFIFIGSGVKKIELETAIEGFKLRNVTLLHPMPRSQQIEFLNACDIGLVSLVSGMYGAAMPSKTYNLLAAGKALLALTEPGTELAMVIDEDRLGWHVEPGDTRELVAKLEEIYATRGQLCEIGSRSRRVAESKYSLDRAIQRYALELRP